jgi:microcystin-dependent protein
MSKISLKTDFADGQILYGADLANNFKVIEAGVNSTEEVLNEAIETSKSELRNELDDITADRGWDWSGANADRVTFFKGTEVEVNAQTIKNGQLLYNTETGATALDHNNKRIVTGSGNVVEINEGATPDNVATKIWINKRKDGEIVDILNYRDNESNAWKELNLAVAGDTFPIGAIAVYPLENAPANWLLLNGQQVSRTEYSELFSILGTTYGEGNGTTTFNLPDFRGRTLVNMDTTDSLFDTVGKTGGEKEHLLTKEELPQIDIATHYANPSTSGGNGNGLQFASTAGTSENILVHNANYGENPVHNNLQPYIVQNYIIKAKQSVGLLGNIVTDITATGGKDVATSKTVKNYVDNQITTVNNTIKDNHKYYISEHIVGTWVDGRNIYRRVFMGKLSNIPDPSQGSFARTILVADASDLDMISAGGKVHNTSDSQINLGYGLGNYGSQVYIYQNQLLIQHTLDIVGDFVVFVEYIKKSEA